MHSLEPGVTPSSSASHQAPFYVQHFLNIAKHFKTVAVWLQFGCGYFFNLLMFSTVIVEENTLKTADEDR